MANALDQIPSRIKYYLLEYKDKNMEDFRRRSGTKKLCDLRRRELKEMFELATNKDIITL